MPPTAPVPVLPCEMAEVAKAWPSLPAAVKAGILAMVEAAARTA